MNIFDKLKQLFLRDAHEREIQAFEPMEEETYVAGERVGDGEVLTEGEGEGASLPTLRKGSNGDDVKLLQEALNKAGFDCGAVDGIFGKNTKKAVEAYQKSRGLKADGIVGRQTWTSLGLMPEEPKVDFVQPPNFKQYDKRWADKMYSNHGDAKQTMKSSACGPTSMADIVAQWWDSKITPYDLAKKSMDWGTRTYDSGTTSTFFRKCHDLYGGRYQTTSSLNTARKCLTEGGYVIVCFGTGSSGKPGYKKWTSGGHYCVIWGYDGDTYFINDPASSKAARAKGTAAEISNCRKGFYCFWR